MLRVCLNVECLLFLCLFLASAYIIMKLAVTGLWSNNLAKVFPFSVSPIIPHVLVTLKQTNHYKSLIDVIYKLFHLKSEVIFWNILIS